MNPRIAWLALMATAGLSPAQETAPAPAPAARPVPAGAFEVNGIAAKVNGSVITKNTVGFMLAPIYARLIAQFPRQGAEFERLALEAREEILKDLIDRQIILTEFKVMEAKGANLPAHVVEKEIDRQVRENYNGSKAKFEEELAKSRMSIQRYREMTREQLIVQAIRQEHFSDAPPPLPGEIAKEYEEMKPQLRDIRKDEVTFYKIFLPRQDAQNPLATQESQLALAEQLAADIKAGSDFSELAKKHSRDAFSAEGGFQENVPRLDLAPEFGSIIFSKKDGEIVGPLQDPAGFTIVKIVHISPGPVPSLSEVRDVVERRVTNKKTSVAYEKWMEGKRRKAMIDKKI